MRKRVVAAVIIIVALLCLYRGVDHLARHEGTAATGNRGVSPSSSTADQNAESTRLPGKVSNRPANATAHATHRPEQLKEFFLPEVAIVGLPLKDALAKLRSAYEDVCYDSGEVPVRLTFVVPPDATRPLTVKTGLRTLDASIHLLAAISGLKVSRSSSEYAFTAPEETGEVVKKTFKIPPDFFSRASDKSSDPFSEGNAPTRLSPAEYFANKGLALDSSTKFSLNLSTLQIETASAADQVAIEQWIDVALNEVPLQHQIETRLIRISAAVDWTPPDLSQLDEAGMTQLMRQLWETKGVDMVMNPATAAKPGEEAKVELIREVLVPSQTAAGEFEPQPAGVILDLRPSPYGFGHQVDLNYSERIAEGESATATAKVTERTSITDSSFSGDGNARLHVQTLPDGTRSIVLVTPTLIDATGQPIHGKE